MPLRTPLSPLADRLSAVLLANFHSGYVPDFQSTRLQLPCDDDDKPLPEVDPAPLLQNRARLVELALDANQRLLLELKLQLDRIQKRSKQLDFAEQALLHAQTYRSPTAPGLGVFADPFDGSTPESNCDVAIETLLYGLPLKTELAYGRSRWTVTEHDLLHQAVRTLAGMLHFDNATGAVASFSETSPQIADSIDWQAVANFVGNRRTASNCKREWMVNFVPALSFPKRPFTISELEQLKQAEADRNGHEWDLIAAKVGGGRTPIECLRQFQQRLNPEMRLRWTADEDARLIACSGEHSGLKWADIALKLGDGRTAAQCKQRLKMLTQVNRKGLWTEAEDAMLMRACNLVGRQDWDEIATHVPERNGTQCRDRSKRQLSQVTPVWSEEDFARFRDACMRSCGRPKWTELAQEFNCSDTFVRKLHGMLSKKGYMQHEPSPASLNYVSKRVLKMASGARCAPRPADADDEAEADND
ncbi:Myb-like DNA-binding domain protein [Geranomyces variabilis]|nr:Myb-like DNA-binding domain protein [Geranomyces variabilis]